MKVLRIPTMITLFLAFQVAAMATAAVPEVSASKFESTILDEVVALQIALPAGYGETTRDYPVLYLLDGNFFMTQAVSAVDFLATPKYMNPVIPGYIIVGISTADRDHDFTPTHDEEYDGMAFPTSGGAQTFWRFMTEELIPFVDSGYRTTDMRILTGWSLGGLFTIWTYLEHPESFGSYLAISPSLWWDDMAVCELALRLAEEHGLGARRLTVTLGGLERAPMDESVKGTFVPQMKSQGPSSSFDYVEIEGEGHNTSPLIALHKGLVSLHRMTMIPDTVVERGADALAEFLIDLAAARGLRTDDPGAAGRFLIKLTVEQGAYDVGMQIATILAEQVAVTPRSMVAVGEMAFRLNRYEESVMAFRTAIAREEALEKPDPEELKYFQEYLEWVQSRID